jgi:hypothetical protein
MNILRNSTNVQLQETELVDPQIDEVIIETSLSIDRHVDR